jgi:tRNA(Ile)-lysidine synthase
MSFLTQIQTYIRRHELLCHDGFYVVALSGGADSVALLRALTALGYRVEAAHCNFQLRGEESRRDENFCVELCRQLGITLHRIHFDTLTYASLHKLSVEMAARDLRYRYFEQLREDLGADDICVAHHRDDQVETVLLNLVRGTGLTGLQGMRPRNGHILRPMLGVTRRQVLDFLDTLHQSYVTDSTNLEADVQRNKLRLNIIPLLENLNPAAKENICRMTENLGEVQQVVDAALRQATKAVLRSDGGIDLERLCREPSPSYLLWTLLAPLGFNRTQVAEMLPAKQTDGILSGQTGTPRQGTQWQSADCLALVDRGVLYLVDRQTWETPLATLRLPEPGTYIYSLPQPEPQASAQPEPQAKTHDLPDRAQTGQQNSLAPLRYTLSQVRFRLSVQQLDTDYSIDPSPFTAQLDASKVRFPLTLRPIAEGDRFVPFGMRGSKLVSNFLTDQKVSPMDRHHQLVLTDASGDIVWLVGKRISGRHAIHPSDPQDMLVVTLDH